MCMLLGPLVRAHVIVECAPLSLLGQIKPQVCLLIIISLYSLAPITYTEEAEAASIFTCIYCIYLHFLVVLSDFICTTFDIN